METNALFTKAQIKTTLTAVPPLKGSAATAIAAVGNQFVGITDVLLEGKVSIGHLEFAMAKLYEAKLAVDAAIANGWQNGQNQYGNG